MVIRDLTLRSAASFGSFHLIRLLFDEYMYYLVEQKVAHFLKLPPVAVMGINTVTYPNGEYSLFPASSECTKRCVHRESSKAVAKKKEFPVLVAIYLSPLKSTAKSFEEGIAQLGFVSY